MSTKGELLRGLRKAKIGYKRAIDAQKYMPRESIPYTQATADRYLAEIQVIKHSIGEI